MSRAEADYDEVRRVLGLNSLHIEVRSEWASLETNSRVAIRSRLKTLTGIDFSDLARLPRSERFSISISHCPSWGGFAMCEESGVVLGFDLEEPGRVSESTVRRISNESELSLSPTPAYLWVAKEAAFKSLRGPQQPAVTSRIEIRAPGPSVDVRGNLRLWSYETSLTPDGKIDGRGVVFEISGVLAALFTKAAST